MHELTLLMNVREILEDHAFNHHFSKVAKVTLDIGKLSCIEADALRFGFDVVMKNSLAENAELTITESNGIGLCLQCEQRFSMENLYDPCKSCGSHHVDVIEGMEMKIKDLIVI